MACQCDNYKALPGQFALDLVCAEMPTGRRGLFLRL